MTKEEYFEHVEKIKNTDNAIAELRIFDEYISISADFELGDSGHLIFDKNNENLNIAFIIFEMIRDHLADTDDYDCIGSFFKSEFGSLFKITKGFSTGHGTIKYHKSEQPPIILQLIDEESFDVRYYEDSGIWDIGIAHEIEDGVEWIDTLHTFRFLKIGSGKVMNTDLTIGIIEDHYPADDSPASNSYIIYLDDTPIITIHNDIRFAYSITELLKKHLSDYANIKMKDDEIVLVPKNKYDFMI